MVLENMVLDNCMVMTSSWYRGIFKVDESLKDILSIVDATCRLLEIEPDVSSSRMRWDPQKDYEMEAIECEMTLDIKFNFEKSIEIIYGEKEEVLDVHIYDAVKLKNKGGYNYRRIKTRLKDGDEAILQDMLLYLSRQGDDKNENDN